MIKPKISPFDEFGPIQISVRLDGSPYTEGKFAPHLHIKAFHTNRKTVRLNPRRDDILEMDVPKNFKQADVEAFIAEHGNRIYADLQEFRNSEYTDTPEPLTYDSKIPFFGEYVPIYMLADGETDECFDNNAVYLKQGLSSGGIRDAVLRLFGNMAYGVLKPRLDHFAEIMNVRYSSLEIDDGRRTWGSFNEVTRVIFMTRRLLMISEACIDSVIVHELAHAKVFAHNETFLDELLKIMPDYEEVDEAAGEAVSRLFEEGWI